MATEVAPAGEAATGKAAAQAQSQAGQDRRLWGLPRVGAPRESRVPSGAGPATLTVGLSPRPRVPRLGLKLSAGRAASTCQVLPPGCCQLRRLAAAF